MEVQDGFHETSGVICAGVILSFEVEQKLTWCLVIL